jgi:hypothetical protein
MNARLQLTLELVTLVHKVVADAGPLPGLEHMRDDDYALAIDQLIAGR